MTETERRRAQLHERRVDLHCWYEDELEPRVVRAVAEGRVDPDSACELHRLMNDLLRSEGTRRVAAQASR